MNLNASGERFVMDTQTRYTHRARAGTTEPACGSGGPHAQHTPCNAKDGRIFGQVQCHGPITSARRLARRQP